MFCSYLIPLFSVDADTPPVGAVVAIVLSALVILTIVIVVIIAVFAIWRNKKDRKTLHLTTDVSMKCSITLYCVLQECVYMSCLFCGTRDCLKFVYDDVVVLNSLPYTWSL